MQVIEQVEFVDVGLVADRNELGKTEIAVGGKIEDRRAQGAALRNEGDVAERGHAGGKTGIESHGRVGIDDAEAVGADKAHARFAANGGDAILDSAAFLAYLAEAC